MRYTYALQHQHGRSSSASSTGSGGRTSRPNLTRPADCMQRMQHTGDQAPARRRRSRRGRRRHGRSQQRALHVRAAAPAGRRQRVQRRQQRPCFVSGWVHRDRPPLDQSRRSCTHGPRSCCRGGQHRGSVMSAAGSDINTEILGIGGRWNRVSNVVGTVEKRPYFYVLGPTYMLVSDFFFAFSSKSRNPARALGGPLPGAPAPWRRHLVRFPRHFAGLGVRCPPLVLRDQRLGSFCACQRPPSIANQQRSAPLIAVIFFFTGPALILCPLPSW